MKVLVVVDVVVVAVMVVVEIAEVCSTRCLYISLAQVELHGSIAGKRHKKGRVYM